MSAEPSATGALAVLADDHRRLRRLFEEYERLAPAAYVLKSKIAAAIIELLTEHTFVSRQVLYPRLAPLLPDGDLAAARAEHDHAHRIATELWTMRPQEARFDAKVAALIDSVRRYLDMQEHRWFGRLAALDGELDGVGAEMVRARRRAPSSPDGNGSRG